MASSLLILLLCHPLTAEQQSSQAMVLWNRGQEAMRDGDNEAAIKFFKKSLEVEPTLARNHLSLAAGHVALGQEEIAVLHLAKYLVSEPRHHVIRSHYAELLWRLGRAEEAKAQFERFIADIQDDEELARQHLVHCHSRLMEIGEAAADSYAERLHRGIGLYHLAILRSRLGAVDAELTVEGLLCQAAGELTLALRERPTEARPCWYLHEVWVRLAQDQPAKRWLRAAENAALGSHLTPHETAHLQLACRRLALEQSHK